MRLLGRCATDELGFYRARKPPSTGRLTPLINALSSERSHLAAFAMRSEEHTSELQSLMRISYAVFCLKTKITIFFYSIPFFFLFFTTFLLSRYIFISFFFFLILFFYFFFFFH